MNDRIDRLRSIWKVAPYLLLSFIATALLWTPTQAQDVSAASYMETIGIVDEMPRFIWLGEWTIDGEKYEATIFTRFRQNKGPLVEGACVKIKYTTESDFRYLTRIETKDSGECVDNDQNDDDQDDDQNDDDQDDDQNDDDQDDDQNDDDQDDDQNDDDQDDEQNDDDQDDEQNDDDQDDEQDGGTATLPVVKTYGLITNLPDTDDLTGVWGIGEYEYTVFDETELDRDHGDFVDGACVEVKYKVAEDGTRYATEIETKHEYKCRRNENQRPHGVLFGVIYSLPEGLIGEWNIGDKVFTADENTEFKEKRRVKFEEGVFVKVRFVEQEDGTLLATKIQAKFHIPWFNPDEGNDDDQDEDENEDENEDEDEEPSEGLRGHAFGQIESYPENLIGEWVVSGIAFSSTVETSYIQRIQPFGVGVPVRVNYTVDANGNRVADLIKSRRSSNNRIHKFCGFVNARPKIGFLGRWLIDNFAGDAALNTTFDETLGVLGHQTYVEVDYVVAEDGTITYQLIKTHIPPGTGDNDASGVLRQIANNVQAASVQSVQADERWTIGDTTYVVTAATELDESQGTLEEGKVVSVNSYTAEDGTEVATQIRAAAVEPVIFLPLSQW